MTDWFNYYGLGIMLLIMVPNIIWAIKKTQQSSTNVNKKIELFEQIGRFGSMFLMIFNIPYTYTGFYFEFAEVIYISVNGTLILLYLVIWVICWNKHDRFKSYALSIIPTLIFIFSGVMLGYSLLIISSVIFGIFHIYISISTISNQ